MRRALPLVALLWAVNLGCKSEECEADSDCPSGEECTSAGACEPITGGVCRNPPCGGFQDSGMNNNPDTGFGDTGMNVGSDGGDSGMNGGGDGGDTGMNGADGGDGGELPDTGDGGPPADGGDAGTPGDGAFPLIPFGEIRVTEVNMGQGFTTYAEFRDRRRAMFQTFTQEYPDPANGTCVISHERLVSGNVLGYEADRIEVDSNNGQQLTYLPQGDGLFEPSAVPSAGLFTGLTGVDFSIVSNNAAGTLDDFAFPTTPGAPTILGLISPTAGVAQTLSQGVTLSWLATTTPNMRRTVVEVYSADYRSRLYCVVVEDGSYTLPAVPVSDFLDSSNDSPRSSFATSTPWPASSMSSAAWTRCWSRPRPRWVFAGRPTSTRARTKIARPEPIRIPGSRYQL